MNIFMRDWIADIIAGTVVAMLVLSALLILMAWWYGCVIAIVFR
jgi:hypothetical protein